MGVQKTFEFIIDGGRATGGPPIGPSLGPLGVNIPAIVERINELTRDFSGMKVPVRVRIDVDTKAFEVEVGTPTTSALIVREAKIEKGSSAPGREHVGNITFEQLVRIARILRGKLKTVNLRACVLQVIGTCISMGVMIDNKPPKEVLRRVKSGEYDEFIKRDEGSV